MDSKHYARIVRINDSKRAEAMRNVTRNSIPLRIWKILVQRNDEMIRDWLIERYDFHIELPYLSEILNTAERQLIFPYCDELATVWIRNRLEDAGLWFTGTAIDRDDRTEATGFILIERLNYARSKLIQHMEDGYEIFPIDLNAKFVAPPPAFDNNNYDW